MSMTRVSRRAMVAVAVSLVLLTTTASAAGAVHRQTEDECEERPLGIGCDRTTTTEPGEEPGGTEEQPPASEPETPTTDRPQGGGTTVPSADGATAGAQGDDEPGTTVDDEPETPADEATETVASTDDGDDGGTSPLLLGVALLIGLGAGVAAGAALMASRQRSGGGPAAAPIVPAAGNGAATDADRRRLVRELIDVRDQVVSEALRSSIGAALAEVGVLEQSVPPGAPFDPQLHKGVDRVGTADPDLDRTVAETERPGYVDRGEPVRLPEVVVRRLDGPGAAS